MVALPVPTRLFSPRGVAGFTLVETLVLLAVLAAVLGVALARLRSVPWKLDRAANQVAQRARVARSLAVMRQHDVIVSFDVGAGVVIVHEDADNNGHQDEGERVLRYPLPEGTSFSRAGAPVYEDYDDGPVTFRNNQVTFLRNGSASEAGAVYVGAAADERAARIIIIARATGYTQMLRYSGAGWIADE